jgi:hypothetical protein
MARQWRLVYAGLEVEPFPTREQADRMVDGLRDKWAAGEASGSVVTVQVNEGRGWKDDEVIDFAHEEGDAA